MFPINNTMDIVALVIAAGVCVALVFVAWKQVNSFSYGFSPVEPQAIPLSAHPTLTGGFFCLAPLHKIFATD